MSDTSESKPSALGKFLAMALILAVAAVVTVTLLVRARRSQQSEALTFATAGQPIGSVVCVAIAKEYFADEGLQVTTLPHKSGKDALQAVIDGKADVCEVAETPVVLATLRGVPVRIFASVAWSQKNLAVAGRKDRGISSMADLQGRKVGVTLRTNGEFFLRQALSSRNIPMAGVELVNTPPDAMVQALTEGAVDAVAAWNPQLALLQKALGTNAVTFYDNSYLWTWNVAALPSYLDNHPEGARKILRALLRSAEFIRSDPEGARAIVATRLGMDAGLLRDIWDVFSFDVAIEQMLLLSLNSQASWAIESKLSDAVSIPDFRETIRPETLKALKPEAVTLAD